MSNNLLWKISFALVWATGAILGLGNALGLKFPDAVLRISGVILLVSIPVLTFSLVRMIKKKQ